MRIIIMRHGDAVFQGAERVLSARGEMEARLTGLKLVSAFNITKIFCSSKLRAQQTAKIVRDLMRGRNAPEIEVLNELNPYGDASLVRDYLEATCTDEDTVLLISHIPQVVNLSWIFCQQELELPTFFTAGALVLEPQKASDASRYCPCLFLAPNREQRLDVLSGEKERVSKINLPHPALDAAPCGPVSAAATWSLHQHGQTLAPSSATSMALEPVAVEPTALASAPTPAPAAPAAEALSPDTMHLSSEQSTQVEMPSLISAHTAHELYNDAKSSGALHLPTAAAAAAVASALVVPAAVKLSETASIPLAVAVAAATIPAAVRKAQNVASHSTSAKSNTPAVHTTPSNLHSQRMLSHLAATSRA